MPITDRQEIIRARRGQGLFKQRVMRIEKCCRITGVDNISHLLASHFKPWRDSSNNERLNGENRLLLTPSIDHLFDRGFIGFENSGKLIISPVAQYCGRLRTGRRSRAGFPANAAGARSTCGRMPSILRGRQFTGWRLRDHSIECHLRWCWLERLVVMWNAVSARRFDLNKLNKLREFSVSSPLRRRMRAG